MTDVSDQATIQEELMRDKAIAYQRSKQSILKPTGYCHNCDELLATDSGLFCNADCRDDWELRAKLAPHP
ncbi:MAG: hypothetical protein WBC07_08445 [Methylotenera sp.]